MTEPIEEAYELYCLTCGGPRPFSPFGSRMVCKACLQETDFEYARALLAPATD